MQNSKLSKPQFCSIWLIDTTLFRCYYAGPEWTWERWQSWGTPHSPKLQHYWNLTNRLFSVISRRLVVRRGGCLPLCRGAVGIFFSLQPQVTGQPTFWISSLDYIYIYIYIYIYKDVWLDSKDTFCLFNLIKTLSSFDKCYGFRLELVNKFTKTLIRKLERILIELYRQNVSLLFKV